MATNPVPRQFSGLARALVQHGLLAEAEAEALQDHASASNSTFVDQILVSKRMTAMELAEFTSRTFGVPLLDLNAFDLSQVPRDWVDTKMLVLRRVLPLHKRGNRLFVATSDLTNLQALEEIRFKTNLVIDPIVVEDPKLSVAIAKIVEASDTTLSTLVSSDDLEIDLNELPTAAATEDEMSAEVDDAPVVRYIQKILLDAISAGASDIHFEPFEKFYRIRYRLDGRLIEIAQPPLVIKDKVASRIKVISKLDIAEKRVPQDGRLKLMLSKNRAIDFRVSTLPTLFGEKIVMRLLDSAAALVGIEGLGYEPDQQALLMHAISRPYGMILVTGPTGSGKTVSLYSFLQILNQPGVNISTAEDPAEISLPGVNQVNINDKAGFTFALALRAFLRQDPDIIMVGEIRDLETADISVKAAQTGHLVLATVHTNDAPSTLMRLVNMGVAPFNVASSVNLITAQRLGRKLCVHCRAPVDIPHEALLRAGYAESDLDGSWQPFGPVGCEQCKGTGYKGRVGIFEVLPISEEMTRILMKNGSVLDIAAQARAEGFRNLRQAGLGKVKLGITSLEEIESITNE
ncbi:MAG: type IV-A pilus assembly ATPase PilB [Reyranella sp.]|nr:type IV-A pilus assembly ATPase PilB [Reyranella sp.]